MTDVKLNDAEYSWLSKNLKTVYESAKRKKSPEKTISHLEKLVKIFDGKVSKDKVAIGRLSARIIVKLLDVIIDGVSTVTVPEYEKRVLKAESEAATVKLLDYLDNLNGDLTLLRGLRYRLEKVR